MEQNYDYDLNNPCRRPVGADPMNDANLPWYRCLACDGAPDSANAGIPIIPTQGICLGGYCHDAEYLDNLILRI